MRRYLLIMCALLASATGALTAQEPACADSATTLAQRRCYSMQLEKSKKATAVLLDSLSHSLNDSTAAALKVATQAWEAYSVAECDAALMSYAGGSQGLVENLSCLTALTEQRRNLLRAFYASSP
jgi:uncharacterized protein YecT (DUF1311 family)